MRIKQDQRGISNVIVVMLSLVILVTIVANVILWSYQMNQLDWEKMQEMVEIVDVTRITSSSWFVAQNEYTVNIGSRTSGTYTDTQTVDGQYERFRELPWYESKYDYRTKVTVTEPNKLARTYEPVEVYVTFTQGRCYSKDTIRVAYWDGSTWSEIPSQVYNVTLWGDNTVKTATIFWNVDVGLAANKNYYIYYDKDGEVSAPSYTGLSTPSVVNRGTTFNLTTAYGTGDTIKIKGTYYGVDRNVTWINLKINPSYVAWDDWYISPGIFHLWINGSDVFEGGSYTGEANTGPICEHSDESNYGRKGSASSVAFEVVGPLLIRIKVVYPSQNPGYGGIISGTFTDVFSIYYTPDFLTTRIKVDHKQEFPIAFTEASWGDWAHLDFPSWDITPTQTKLAYRTSAGIYTETLTPDAYGGTQHSDWTERWIEIFDDVTVEPALGLFFMADDRHTIDTSNYRVMNVGGSGTIWGIHWFPYWSVGSTVSGNYNYQFQWVAKKTNETAPIRNEYIKAVNPVSTFVGPEERWNWWNTNYDYRRQITVTNNIASTLSSGYSVLLTMDTVSLVSSGKMLSNGDDLRVVYWSGSSWIELDREVLNMNTTSTQVWFKTQAVIGASATDSDYYIYYGNPSAGSPPTNKSNIYQFWDDFDDGLLGSEWSAESIGGGSHTLTESGSTLNITSHYTGDIWGTSDTFTYVYLSDYTGSLEVSAYVSAAGGLTTWVKVGGVHLRDDNSTGAKNMQASPTDAYGLTNSHRKTTGGSTEEDLYGSGYMIPEYLMLRKNGDVITPLRSEDGQSWTSWTSDTVVFTEPFLVGMPVCSMGIADTWAAIEWFKIRLYVDPEPSTSLGSEEGQKNNRLDIDGTFIIDVSTYPLAYIQTIEIQLRYRSNDAGEKWYLKAYNWTAMTYSDNGFNSTVGHTPTMGWDYYAVNLTDKWRSYVKNNGTMHIKVLDEGADNNQTTLDIDFLSVRVAIDGSRFTFKNGGSLTAHLVSLWVINSTVHQRYDISVFVNSGETLSYIRADICLPGGEYMVKIVTERGNIAVYSGS